MKNNNGKKESKVGLPSILTDQETLPMDKCTGLAFVKSSRMLCSEVQVHTNFLPGSAVGNSTLFSP